MGILYALQVRLRDEGVIDGDDGYYIRTKQNKKIGPMLEQQFRVLRDSDDIHEIASAWRVAGGSYFKVQLRRGVVWDSEHVCSCKACGHAAELVIIIFCFLSILGVFCLMFSNPKMNKEREQAGEGTWRFLEFLFLITIGMVILTVRKLLQRWRKVSTEMFVSEV